MRTINVDLVEKIILVSEQIKKIGENTVFSKEGLTTLQFNILWVMIADEAKTINEVKKKLLISSASMSQTINRMEKNGLITRKYGLGDRRQVYVDPTKSGQEIYARMSEKYIKTTDEYLSVISKKDKEILMEKLGKVETLIRNFEN